MNPTLAKLEFSLKLTVELLLATSGVRKQECANYKLVTVYLLPELLCMDM